MNNYELYLTNTPLIAPDISKSIVCPCHFEPNADVHDSHSQILLVCVCMEALKVHILYIVLSVLHTTRICQALEII